MQMLTPEVYLYGWHSKHFTFEPYISFTSTQKYIPSTLPINSKLEAEWPGQSCMTMTGKSTTETGRHSTGSLWCWDLLFPSVFFSLGDPFISPKNLLQKTMMHLVNCSEYLQCLMHMDLKVTSPSSHRQKSLVDYHKFKLQVQIKIKLMKHSNVI